MKTPEEVAILEEKLKYSQDQLDHWRAEIREAVRLISVDLKLTAIRKLEKLLGEA